jgi:hypothetical protein
MPSDKEIEVILRLRDEVTKGLKTAQENLHKFSNQVKEIGNEMRKTGRQISSLGSTMAMAGTAITAPLIAAYKTAGKFNAEIAHQLRETQNVFDRLALSIGKSLLPVMRQLTDAVANMVGWWENLDKATRDRIIQNIWRLGVSLVSLGAAFVIVGKSIAFLANLALVTSSLMAMNPVVLGVAAAIAVLIFAFWNWTEALAPVINWLDVLNNYCAITIDQVLLLKNVLTLNFADVKKDWESLGKKQQEINDILLGRKDGNTVRWIQQTKQQLKDFKGTWDSFIAGVTGGKGADVKTGVGGFWSAFEIAITEAHDNMIKLRDLGVEVANQLTTSLSTAFAGFINDAFTGQLKRAQDYFAEFGKSIINIFAQAIAKMAADWIAFRVMIAGKNMIGNVLGLLGNLGGGSSTQGVSSGIYGSSSFVNIPTNTVATPYYHSGGIIRAHNGLAVDEVPIIAQTGERVLSRAQNKEYESNMGKTINYYIYAMDASSFAQMLYKNKGSIHSIVSSGMRQNTPMRGSVKSYG